MLDCLSSTSHESARLVISYAWVLDSGASRHMMGIREGFLIVFEIGSYIHLRVRINIVHVMKGFGKLLFHLES